LEIKYHTAKQTNTCWRKFKDQEGMPMYTKGGSNLIEEIWCDKKN